MFNVPLLIIISFSLVLLILFLMLVNIFLGNKYRWIVRSHYFLFSLSFLMYLLAVSLVVFDGRIWSQFKSELCLLLAVYLLTLVSGWLGGYKKQRLIHYLTIFLLVAMILFMHFKWSGLI